MTIERRCCCPSIDPDRCFDLRYHGYVPASCDQYADRERCECACHDRDDDEEDGW